MSKIHVIYLITREDSQQYIGKSTLSSIKSRMKHHASKNPRFQGYQFEYVIIYFGPKVYAARFQAWKFS